MALLFAAAGAMPGAAQEDPEDIQQTAKTKPKYNVAEEGNYTPSLLETLKASLPLYTQRKDPPKSRAQLRGRLKTSLAAAQKVLQSQGYYAGRVTGRLAPQIDRNANQKVLLTIEQGERYVYSAADIRITSQPDETLKAALTQTSDQLTAAGAPALAGVGIRLAPALVVRLRELGHPFAKSTKSRFIVDHAARTVTPIINIDPGPKARIAELDITGLQTVEASYVRLLADFGDNPVYDQRAVDGFRERLIQTGLFSGIQLTPVPPAAGAAANGDADITLSVQLTEAPLRQVSAQAGFSTDEGFSLEGGWTHRNFFGRGEVFSVRGRIAQLEQSLETVLTLPNFKRIDQSLNLSFGIARQDTDAFTLFNTTTSAILERRLSERWVVSGGGRAEAQRIEDDLGKRTFYLGALPLSARYDGTNNIFDPQNGIRLNTLITPEAGLGDATLFFVTSDVLLRAYKSFDWFSGTVLAARARIGAVYGEDTATLPANRRFYAGGGGSIRGYGFQNVGPLNDDGDPFGGRSLIELSAEARFKVTPTIGVVPFLDVGNVYQSALPKLSGLQYGAGIGLRYYTDFAPVRLDIGTPINPRPGDDPVQVYISIGQSF